MVKHQKACKSRPAEPLTAVQRELAGRQEHIELAHTLADRYAARHRRPADDYRAAALFGLVRAARRYQPERGPFSPFAAAHIRGAILDDLRVELGGGLGGSVGRRPVYSDQGDEFFEAIPADESPVGWEAESEDTVRACCRRLPARMGAALSAYLLRADRVTLAAVGVAVGVCEGQAARIIGSAVKILASDVRTPIETGGRRWWRTISCT